MIFVVHGAVTIDGKTFTDGEAWHGTGEAALVPGKDGVTLWRYELAPPGGGGSAATGPGVASREKLTAVLDTLPKGDLLMRGDSVAFPPGGCAYLHTHQGPGIRCLIDGGIRIDTHGRSTSYGPGSPWFEAGPEPVFAQAASRPAEPLHPGDDPAARAARQKLVRARQRGGQGEAARAAVQGVRRRADRAAEGVSGQSFSLPWYLAPPRA